MHFGSCRLSRRLVQFGGFISPIPTGPLGMVSGATHRIPENCLACAVRAATTTEMCDFRAGGPQYGETWGGVRPPRDVSSNPIRVQGPGDVIGFTEVTELATFVISRLEVDATSSGGSHPRREAWMLARSTSSTHALQSIQHSGQALVMVLTRQPHRSRRL